jgi:hypothetical protein
LNGAGGAVEAEVRAAVRDLAVSINSSHAVVADTSTLIRVTTSLPLSNLAYWEQVIRSEFSIAQRLLAAPRMSGWLARLPFVTPTKRIRADAGRILTWVDVCSYDGYIRERALHTLTGSAPNSFFLAMAARRLNDWVPQVRSAARASVLALARASDPEHVVDVLCATLPTWTTWGRVEPLGKQVMMELLSIETVAEALRRRLISRSAGPMSAILSQALRTTALDDYLIEMAKDAVQPAVRARAQRALLAGKAVWVERRRWHWIDVRYCKGRMENVLAERPLARTPPLVECLETASTDRSSIVRRVAAEVLVGKVCELGSSALPLARRLAGDVSPKVAERAVFVLERLGVAGVVTGGSAARS